MKKKLYIQPSIDLVEVESNNLMVTSPGPETSNEGISGEIDAASYRNNLWEN